MSHPQAGKFSLKIPVQKSDIDELGHVNNVVYLRWVQEVAQAHWLSAAPAPMLEQYSWVVLRHEIDYHRPAMPGEIVTGYTWVGEHKGARFDRYVSLYRGDSEELLASAKTNWCLLDAKTMRPKRIEDDVLAIL